MGIGGDFKPAPPQAVKTNTMHTETLPHNWTNKERTAFIKQELEKEREIKKIIAFAYHKSSGVKITPEQFLNSKLVNPPNNKFI